MDKNMCISIPLVDEEILSGSINEKIEKILYQYKHIFFEFRFDYLKDFKNLDEILKKISNYKKQSIYTLRPINEGGNFNGQETERIELLKKLGLSNPMFLDIEYECISKFNSIADFIDQNQIRTIVSWHDFNGTPDKEILLNLINKMTIFSNYIKIVTTAKSIDDSILMMNLYKLIDSRVNLIAFSMGELGIISRILCNIVGYCPFTYVSVDKAVAPGQLSLAQMESIFSLFHDKLI